MGDDEIKRAEITNIIIIFLNAIVSNINQRIDEEVIDEFAKRSNKLDLVL